MNTAVNITLLAILMPNSSTAHNSTRTSILEHFGFRLQLCLAAKLNKMLPSTDDSYSRKIFGHNDKTSASDSSSLRCTDSN